MVARLLWAMKPSAAGGRYSEASEWQRSKKSRKCVSPKIFSGTARGGVAEDAGASPKTDLTEKITCECK